ncbi:hypothetical protein [Glycomyces harbinensis]|uniref:Uncharacterized protein n=1 Tax=Glycomyces harbinensis TaxID=58114 RepID=A0A1G6XG23_9ACTN|nr:hypothetical protein [Glycomyces harbinensis]SDD76146.1 hypothetical protein SAMN05216270_107111 [Glycomyces harbinensis]
MPKGDQSFISDARTAHQQVERAIMSKTPLGAQNGEAAELLTSIRFYTGYFIEVGAISGGTAQVRDRIVRVILPELERYELANTQNPAEIIRGKLVDWEGPSGSSAYQFKWDYLPALAGSLEMTFSAFQALAGVMAAMEAVLDKARERYLALMSSAVDAITEGAESGSPLAEATSATTQISSAIGTGFGVGAVIGPVAGAIVGVLGAIGAIIDAATADTGGDGVLAVMRNIVERLAGIKSALEAEAPGIERALDDAMAYLSGSQRDKFTAPEVFFPA